MISKNMVKAINEQINKEIFSAYLYQSMAAYSTYNGLKGFANWFDIQKQEELFHAQKFYNYLLNQGEQVILEAIDKPKNDFKSPIELFEETLKHEKIVTALINNLVKIAKTEEDNASFIFLQWFVTEQIEEEANPTEIIARLKLIGNDGAALYMVDKELALRVFTQPVLTE